MMPHVPKKFQTWKDGKRILIVLSGPTKHEDVVSHRPGTGDSGELLAELLEQAGYEKHDYSIVQAFRCKPKGKAKFAHVKACRPFLLHALKVLQPAVVIAMGTWALKAVLNSGKSETNVTRYRGQALSIPGAMISGARVYCTYSPGSVLEAEEKGEFFRNAILADFARLTWPHLDPPIPDTAIGPYGNVVAVDTEWAPDLHVLTTSYVSGALARVDDIDDKKQMGFAPFWKDITHSLVLLKDAKYLAGYSMSGDVDALVRTHQLPPALKERCVDGRGNLDALLLIRLCDENQLSYKLQDQLLANFNVDAWKDETEGLFGEDDEFDMRKVPPELRKTRCLRDTWGADLLARKYTPLVPVKLRTFTHQIAMAVHRIELAGAIVNMNVFNGLGHKYADAMLAAQSALDPFIPEELKPFSPTNDDQIRTLLYDHYELPILVETETGLASVAKPTLKRLIEGADEKQAEMLKALGAFSAAEKLYTTNIAGLNLRQVGMRNMTPYAYLQFHINPLGARTGRRSTHDPNSQNWTAEVRNMVCSRYDKGSIGAFDYMRLEVRLHAWLSKCWKLLEFFMTGNGYVNTAKFLFGYDVKEKGQEYRAVKAIVLGVIYNLKHKHLAESLWHEGVRYSEDYETHEKAVLKLLNKFMDKFPEIEEYNYEREAEVAHTGQVVALTGQVRHLPCPQGKETPGFWHLRNEGINFPTQHLASAIAGSAMMDVERAIAAADGMSLCQRHEALLEGQFYYLTKPANGLHHPYEMTVIFNEVHDELVIDFPPNKLQRDTEIITHCMKTVPTLKKLCPDFDTQILGVSPHVAACWEKD